MPVKIFLLTALFITGLYGFTEPVRAQAQAPDRQQLFPGAPEIPAERDTVVTGRITDVDIDSMTIRYNGANIRVNAGNIAETAATGSLDDYYDIGMLVTVEGAFTDDDEIDAFRISPGQSYNPAAPEMN